MAHKDQPNTSEVDGPRSYSVRAVDRVCDILDLMLARNASVTLGEVAEQVDLPKSSAFRYLRTLESRRYVQRESETGAYRLGRAFLRVRSRQAEVLAQHVRPFMARLVQEFDETVNLGMLDANRLLYLEILESTKTVRLAARVGDRYPIHCSAEGKAIAAHLPEDLVRSILATEGMPRFTPTTITTVDRLLDELTTVREVGYAVDNGENEIDGRSVAVPLLGMDPPAALGLSAPVSRFPTDEIGNVAASLQQAAGDIAKGLAAGPASFVAKA